MQDNTAEKQGRETKDKKPKAQPATEKQGITNHPLSEEDRRQSKVIPFPDKRQRGSDKAPSDSEE